VAAPDADDAIAALRRARPDLPEDVASPASEAAQALLEEILSMPTIDDIEPAPTGTAPTVARTGPRAPSRDRRRRALLLGAATTAVAAAAAVAVVVVGPGGGPGTGTVEAGSSTPASGEDSGRLEVRWDLDWEVVPAGAEIATSYEFDGDDLRWEQPATGDRYVEVDGRAWQSVPTFDELAAEVAAALAAGDEPQADLAAEELTDTWTEIAPHPPGPAELDPATLLDGLAAVGPFEAVGDEELDGVAVERRRAANPAALGLADLHLTALYEHGRTTGVEAWVDGDGQVRRLEVTSEGTEQGGAFTETFSLAWTDLGEPITIEPPAPGDVVGPVPDDRPTADPPGDRTEAQAALDAVQAALDQARVEAIADAADQLDAAQAALDEAMAAADEAAAAEAQARLDEARAAMDLAQADGTPDEVELGG
jgi:hypothetical protein